MQYEGSYKLNYNVFFAFLVFITDVLVPQVMVAEKVAIANSRVRDQIFKRRKHYHKHYYKCLKSPTHGHSHIDLWADEYTIKKNSHKEKGVHISNSFWW